MMLELLMTRQNSLDQAVISNAQNLDFIVLDELHTHRGRQGADVAMLVRRLRDRLCRDRPPLCIGTSATMSSQDDETSVLLLFPAWRHGYSEPTFLPMRWLTKHWSARTMQHCSGNHLAHRSPML